MKDCQILSDSAKMEKGGVGCNDVALTLSL